MLRPSNTQTTTMVLCDPITFHRDVVLEMTIKLHAMLSSPDMSEIQITSIADLPADVIEVMLHIGVSVRYLMVHDVDTAQPDCLQHALQNMQAKGVAVSLEQVDQEFALLVRELDARR